MVRCFCFSCSLRQPNPFRIPTSYFYSCSCYCFRSRFRSPFVVNYPRPLSPHLDCAACSNDIAVMVRRSFRRRFRNDPRADLYQVKDLAGGGVPSLRPALPGSPLDQPWPQSEGNRSFRTRTRTGTVVDRSTDRSMGMGMGTSMWIIGCVCIMYMFVVCRRMRRSRASEEAPPGGVGQERVPHRVVPRLGAGIVAEDGNRPKDVEKPQDCVPLPRLRPRCP
mmetsp:Transcript_3491/g.9776  ORF Transcript_3491/g.9776 Transcript_3491/m.9776 type:complete len:221 (-) Transcript_3491:431-1093(-)